HGYFGPGIAMAGRDGDRVALVLPDHWLGIRDGERPALVFFGASWPIEHIGGNIQIMQPHILAALQNLRVVEVMPHRLIVGRESERRATTVEWRVAARRLEEQLAHTARLW